MKFVFEIQDLKKVLTQEVGEMIQGLSKQEPGTSTHRYSTKYLDYFLVFKGMMNI